MQKGGLPMKRALILNYVLALCALLLITTATTAFARSNIKGKVVDLDTGKPIEKAAIFIHWWKVKGMPGLWHSEDVERSETVTNDQGDFETPEYSTLVNEFRMAVYKMGYVCWSSESIFPSYEKRTDFSLRDGIIIKLEQFSDKYSRKKHADFVDAAAIWSTGVFLEATKPERQLLYDVIRKKAKEQEGSK
jgi:hypothetical protein